LATSKAIIDRLNAELTRILQDPEIRDRLINYGTKVE